MKIMEIKQIRDTMLRESACGRIKLSMAAYEELFSDKMPTNALNISAENAESAFRQAKEQLQRIQGFSPLRMMLQLTFRDADTRMEEIDYLHDFTEWCNLDDEESCCFGLTVGADIPQNCHLSIIYC